MSHTTNFLSHFKTHWLQNWRALAKKNVWYFLLLFLISIAATWIAESFSPWTDANGQEIINWMKFIADWLSVFISAIMWVVSISIYLDLVHWKSFSFRHFNLKTRAQRWMIWKWLWTYIVMTLIVLWWVILLIIPWIYFAYRLSFRQYFLIDKKMWVMESLRASWDITKWHVRELVWVSIIALWVVLLWFLALFIGLLRAVPTVKLAYADLYKKITS